MMSHLQGNVGQTEEVDLRTESDSFEQFINYNGTGDQLESPPLADDPTHFLSETASSVDVLDPPIIQVLQPGEPELSLQRCDEASGASSTLPASYMQIHIGTKQSQTHSLYDGEGSTSSSYPAGQNCWLEASHSSKAMQDQSLPPLDTNLNVTDWSLMNHQTVPSDVYVIDTPANSDSIYGTRADSFRHFASEIVSQTLPFSNISVETTDNSMMQSSPQLLAHYQMPVTQEYCTNTPFPHPLQASMTPDLVHQYNTVKPYSAHSIVLGTSEIQPQVPLFNACLSVGSQDEFGDQSALSHNHAQGEIFPQQTIHAQQTHNVNTDVIRTLPVRNSEIQKADPPRKTRHSKSYKRIQTAQIQKFRDHMQKKKAVPSTMVEAYVLANCQASNHEIVRDKANIRAVKQVGGPCMLCIFMKKKCSGERPCAYCKAYWGKRQTSSTSFTWTCDVRSNIFQLAKNYFVEYFDHFYGECPFRSQPSKPRESDVYWAIAGPESGRRLIEDTSLQQLLNILEPHKRFRHFTISNPYPLADRMFSYGYALSRQWLGLSYLDHDTSNLLLKGVEKVYVLSCLLLFGRIEDKLSKRTGVDELLLAVNFLQELADMLVGQPPRITFKNQLHTHLISALTSFTAIMASSYINSKPDELEVRAFFRDFAVARYVLPFSYEGPEISPLTLSPISKEEILREPCLLRFHKSGVIDDKKVHREYCCCNLMYNSIPTGLLGYFEWNEDDFVQMLGDEMSDSIDQVNRCLFDAIKKKDMNSLLIFLREVIKWTFTSYVDCIHQMQSDPDVRLSEEDLKAEVDIAYWKGLILTIVLKLSFSCFPEFLYLCHLEWKESGASRLGLVMHSWATQSDHEFIKFYKKGVRNIAKVLHEIRRGMALEVNSSSDSASSELDEEIPRSLM
ncbi:hypothetical protein B0J11DRAFT_570358 [Dendryphion nanum]|uniref:Uncharacterized protein n=1 Tax=Dendryphion nanum TaxID=256645 RepID=A0A9P9DIU0_9PLEO|nr:hypothetical protein B0J11DRAFT_570358 [Dendryphion nanum]